MVLDEIHKDRRWKARLKGVFDVDGPQEGIIVTGSARLVTRTGYDRMYAQKRIRVTSYEQFLATRNVKDAV